MSFFKIIPNITIMAPKDFKELKNMMDYAISIEGPVVIRYPRGTESDERFKIYSLLSFNKSEILTRGNDVTIIAIGNQVSKAMKIARKLKHNKINAEVINTRFLKPFDKYTILQSISKTKFAVTMEDNTLIGGLASSVKEAIGEKRLDVKLKSYGYPDVFVEHGSVDELEKKYRLDEESIFRYIKKEIIYKNNRKN